MILRGLRITNYRSIVGPVDLLIDRRVTVLVGANDHGKSNILNAIRSLNDDAPLSPDDINWDAPDGADAEIVFDFDLTSDEIAKLGASRAAAAEAEAAEIRAAGDGPEMVVSKPPTTIRVRRTTRSPTPEVLADTFVPLSEALTLLKWRPRIEIFTPGPKVSDEITLAQLDDPAFEFMKGIFIKAGLWEQRKEVFAFSPKTTRMLSDGSALLTSRLQREWEQGRGLRWKLQSAPGDRIQVQIEDPAVSKTNVLPSQRSTGFTNFFMLSLTLFARTSNNPERNFIYLFDEPGTWLHPVAQVNLQRVFESIADDRQLVYSTHSVFLVNKNEPLRNRVIRKTESGTEIDKKPYARNWKAVRDSLGVLFSNNFFVADRTLLVEGPSDPIYLLAALLYLIRRKSLDIDLNAFSVMDGGTETNYLAMAQIMLAEGRRVHCLLDGDSHGQRLKDRLTKIAQRSIDDGSLLIDLLPPAHSVEDLVPHRNLLVKAAQEAVLQLLADGICKLKPESSSAELTKAIEVTCGTNPASETLGRRIIAAVASHFVDNEEISKVNIACRYEDLLRSLDSGAVDEPAPLTQLIENMRQHLALESRKAPKEALVSEDKNV